MAVIHIQNVSETEERFINLKGMGRILKVVVYFEEFPGEARMGLYTEDHEDHGAITLDHWLSTASRHEAHPMISVG